MHVKPGPIIFAEDDVDDQELLKEAFDSFNIPNKLLFFSDGLGILEYLRGTSEQPFIIFSDINMPRMNGLELRDAIDADEKLRRKSIPFIFLSTQVDHETIIEAYDRTVQGFFKKPDRFENLKEILKMIIDYWGVCKHPNN